ncbi:EAL domain-containing protein [Methylomonas sp. MgM2]
MRFIPIRYGIPLLIVLFTLGLTAYTVRRDWETAEAVVRGEAISHMMGRAPELKQQFRDALNAGKLDRLADDVSLIGRDATLQSVALTDDSAIVMNATNQDWVGRSLYQLGTPSWQSRLSEPLQTIIERVKRQSGGEVHLIGEGRYLLAVYPASLGGTQHQDRDARMGALVIWRDLSPDLARARQAVSEKTTEMVGLLTILAFVIGLLVHVFFTRRLEHLVHATVRFAGGDLDARSALRGRDEVAMLGRAFDRMAAHVADTQRDLEHRVRTRTAELANTVEDLQREIAVRKQTEIDLYNQKERSQVTLASIGDAVITTDIQGRIEYFNALAETLAGLPQQLAIGRGFTETFGIVDEISRLPINDPVRQCVTDRKVVELSNILLLRPNQKELSIDISAAPIHGSDGVVMGAVLVCRDVTDIRTATHQLIYQASHDALTGLINRSEFERRLKRVLTTAAAEESHAMLYLDLDQFKIVNDTCGHAAGDELLRQVGGILAPAIRKRDTLARLGGDEFGVLLEHCGLEQALYIAQQLRSIMQEFTFVWNDRSFKVGVSVGLVPIEPGIDTLTGIFRTADSACYAAKERGRNRVHVYQAGDQELAQRQGEMQWVPRIQEALAEDRFALFFQPIFPLQANRNTHYEVLLRMLDRSGELIPPSVFIPAAERYSQMQAIDRWVVRNAFILMRDPAIVPKSVSLAINLSGQSLSDPMFLEFVEQQVTERGVPLDRICFEITETAAISNLSHARRFFSALKPRGCSFALDDFGSGLSSFAYLKTLPIEYLKIDGRFVKDMVNDPTDYAMVEAIHRIGHVMGLATIAEFVENEDILNLLKTIGVNYAQGYCLAKPKPLTAMS